MKKTNKILAVILAILMVISIIPITASAATYSGTCGDNVFWTYDDATYTLIFSGTGEMYGYNSNNRPWVEHSTFIQKVVINDGVTSIGRNAFYNCDSLESIDIPDSVTSIGAAAFCASDGLKSIEIPGSVSLISSSAFSGCKGLEEIILNEGVKTIEERAFENCSKLAQIEFPSTLEGIGKYAFTKSGLTSVTIPASAMSFGVQVFAECPNLTEATFADGATFIGREVFYNCTALKNVYIPSSVTTARINTKAFYGCTALENVYFDGTLEEWFKITFVDAEAQPLYYAKNLYCKNELVTEIVVPESIITIKDFAFYNYAQLTSVKIPSTVKAINKSAFSNCSGLKNLTIEEGVSSFNNFVFYNCDALTNVTIPGSLKDMGNNVFDDCDALTNVVFADGCTSTGTKTFNSCDALKEVVLPTSMTAIGDNAFSNCISLEKISIPAKVTSMGFKPFALCESLTSITVDDENKQFSSEDGVLFNKDKTSLIYYPIGKPETSYKLPEGVTTLQKYAFNNSSLKSVMIPTSMSQIYGYAFYECNEITDIYYSGTKTQWNDIAKDDDYDKYLGNAILHCEYEFGDYKYTVISEADKTIRIEKYNLYDFATKLEIPSVIDGYTVREIGPFAFGSRTELTKIIIPDTVAKIDESAFYQCTGLTKIVIPESVIEISANAFYGCTNIYNVLFNNSIKKIDIGAFNKCTKLKDVYYTGTEAQWNSVTIGDDNNPLINATMHFEYNDENGTHSGTCGDNLTWNFNAVSGTLTISGNGDMYNYTSSEGAPWKTHGNLIENIVICDGVTLIGEYAFHNCTNFNNISMADSVTTIGSYAFYNCNGLTDIVIGKGVKKLNRYTFYCCSSLETITFDKNVKSIHQYVVGSCSNLSDVYYLGSSDDWGNTSIGYNCFWPGEIHILGDETHECSTKYIYDSVVTVPTCTEQGYTTYFCRCGKTRIDDYVDIDKNNHSYTSEITTPATHTTTGLMTYTCACGDSYTEVIAILEKHNYDTVVTAPTCTEQGYTTYTCDCGDSYVDDFVDATGHTDNDNNGFCDICDSLVYPSAELCGEKVVWTFDEETGTLTIFGTGDMYDFEVDFGGFTISPFTDFAEAVKHIVIGDNVTSVGDFAFDDFKNLETVSLGSSITRIGRYAFNNCYLLTNITLPDGLKEIDSFAFRNCTSLTNVTLPDSLEIIGRYAFGGCESFSSVTIPISVQSIDNGAFYSCPNLKDVYYEGTKEQMSEILPWLSLDPVFSDAKRHYNSTGADTHPYKPVITPPTCTEQGYTTYTCDCGYSNGVDNYVDALGHDYDYGNGVLTRPTETEKGFYTYTCKNDTSHITTQEVESADYTEYNKAARKLEEYLSNSNITSEAKSYIISECMNIMRNNSELYDFSSLTERRDLIVSEQYIVDKATKEFNEFFQVIDSVIANCESGNHDVRAYISNDNATCTVNGTKRGTCYYCGTEVIIDDENNPALGHDIVVDNLVAPDCLNTGLTEGSHCSRCDGATTEQEVVPALGHSYNPVVTAPNCTERGYTTYTCECGDTYIADYVDAIGHTPANAVEENHVTPTCMENGSKDVVVYCSVCDEEISRETVTLDATGHTDNDGDGYCDADNELLDPSVECECNCHKDGFKGFFWNIRIFFSRLFGTNKLCECNVAHY